MTRITQSAIRPWMLAALAAAIGIGAPALLTAQTKKNAPPPSTQPGKTGEQGAAKDGKKSARPDRGPEPRREPSATDILRELTERNKKRSRVVPPSLPGRSRRTKVSPEGVPTNAVAQPERKLLPDGYRLVDRPGRLVREGDGFVFAFESCGLGAPELPLRLLPNRLLEDMEIKSDGGEKSLVFIVSGELTEYRGVNYFLIQKLLIRSELGNFK